MTDNAALPSRVQRWQDMPWYERNDRTTYNLIRDLASALQQTQAELIKLKEINRE